MCVHLLGAVLPSDGRASAHEPLRQRGGLFPGHPGSPLGYGLGSAAEQDAGGPRSAGGDHGTSVSWHEGIIW